MNRLWLLLILCVVYSCSDSTTNIDTEHRLTQPKIDGPTSGYAPFDACWSSPVMTCTYEHPVDILLYPSDGNVSSGRNPEVCIDSITSRILIIAYAKCIEGEMNEQVKIVEAMGNNDYVSYYK